MNEVIFMSKGSFVQINNTSGRSEKLPMQWKSLHNLSQCAWCSKGHRSSWMGQHNMPKFARSSSSLVARQLTSEPRQTLSWPVSARAGSDATNPRGRATFWKWLTAFLRPNHRSASSLSWPDPADHTRGGRSIWAACWRGAWTLHRHSLATPGKNTLIGIYNEIIWAR